MKEVFTLIGLVFMFFSLSIRTFSLSMDTFVVILPGYFYFNINGDLQSGINLSGLKPADLMTSQVGYWNGDKNFDYIYFYDSSEVPGFRLQMYLDGDFEYIGSYSDQSDISASNFLIYPSWDNMASTGLAPSVGENNPFYTLNVDGSLSCKPDPLQPYSSYYFFDNDFLNGDFSKSFSNSPFSYLVSQNSCKNEGRLYIGRFQLNLGVVRAGEYRSSLYIIMLDGY